MEQNQLLDSSNDMLPIDAIVIILPEAEKFNVHHSTTAPTDLILRNETKRRT